MPRAVRTKWTPEAEQAAAKMWNAYVDTTRIIMALKAEHGLVVKPTDLQALAKRKGGALNMIDGEERKRAPRGDRIENRTVRVRRGAVRKAMTQAKAETIEGTPFDQLQAGQCRYPLTKSLPHLFCTAKAIPGKSWCEPHLNVITGKKP